ncbi:MAG: hypothetical protein OEW83_22700 [Acidimicrobiia bacterium]|nr:hypothetical protein [Acidimicrobiia bacterium]
MPEPEQFAALELFRGTMTRHNVIAYGNDSPLPTHPVRWDDEDWKSYVPIRPTTVTMVEDRLPPGVAAVLINRAHTDRDLVFFLDAEARRIVEQLDDERPLGDLDGSSAQLFQRLWWHDLIMVDAAAAISH